MSPDKWKKVKEIFAVAVELSGAEREKFFVENLNGDEEIRLKVEEMIRADEAEDESLENPVIDLSNFWNEEEVETFVGKEIGAYKIQKEIGRGGMGVVFEAIHQTEDVSQKVALKILKRGLESEAMLRRFRNERKILASLEHPNIARLLDGGTTKDGLPFYVMEFVEGVPIDEFCKNLNLEEKLQLFQQVCKAVAYAHTRLVVHRDLKPSNILVNSEGTVKLLDFGIAKLISDDSLAEKGTATQFGMMTPNYASPEQFRGEQVTTATDIYSLGVILYEILTGVLPYDLKDKTLDKVLEILTKDETVKPSLVNSKFKIQNSKLIPSDVDNIVLKSLHKEPERRYQSVKDFSEDLRRFLVGLPITARPDTFGYRASKFVQRNKLAVAAVSLVFLSLIGGLIGIYYQYRIAQRERALAEKRFADVRELANKVVFRYHDEIAKFPGAVALREELVNDAVKYLDNLNAEEIDDNSLKIELAKAYLKIGDVQGRPYAANLGKTEDALTSYQKAVDILQNAAEKSPKKYELKRELVRAMTRLTALKARMAKANFQDGLDPIVNLQIEVNEADKSNPNQNANDLAEAYILKGDYMAANPAERIEVHKKANELLENIPDKTQEIQHNLVRVNQRLGSNYIWLGDDFAKKGEQEKALENYRNALQYNEKMFESVKAEIAIVGETQNLSRNLSGAYQNLGENYFKLGEKEKGLEMLQKNLEMVIELAKADDKNTEAQIDVANAYVSFADAYKQFGDYQKALESNTKSLEILEKMFLLDNKNLETSHGIVRRMNAQTEFLEKINRANEAKTYRNKLAEMCKSDSNASPCIEIGLVK